MTLVSPGAKLRSSPSDQMVSFNTTLQVMGEERPSLDHSQRSLPTQVIKTPLSQLRPAPLPRMKSWFPKPMSISATTVAVGDGAGLAVVFFTTGDLPAAGFLAAVFFAAAGLAAGAGLAFAAAGFLTAAAVLPTEAVLDAAGDLPLADVVALDLLITDLNIGF